MTTHAIQRAQERYGLTLDGADIAAILAMVCSGRSVMTRRKDDRSEIHAVSYRSKTLIILVDQHRRTIVSFFPPGALAPMAAGRNGGRKPGAPNIKKKPTHRRRTNHRSEE